MPATPPSPPPPVSRELRSALERAALAARAVGLGTWELDLQTRMAVWDEAMWTLRGLTPRQQAPGHDEMRACLHPDDRDRAAAALEQAELAGAPVDQEFRIVRPDGSVRWLASRSMEIEAEAGGARRRIGVNWDITDARTAREARQEREMALRESQAKSRFLSRMSHELRTPLNAVLGFAQLLQAAEQGDDAAAEMRRRRVGQIAAAGAHLLNLINDVLELSSLEGGEVRIELEAAPLAPLVAQTLALLEPQRSARQVRVECTGLEAVAAVMTDPARMRQVLLNLLGNAIKYNREGGVVRVEAMPRGDRVLLRIGDTGQGMSDAQLLHLFEPFNRLGRHGSEGATGDGSGIGLVIVKALVERMGGSIHVDSSVDVGSVFELRLTAAGPVDDVVAAPTAAAVAPAAPVAGADDAAAEPRQRLLLYIEDNAVNALIIGELIAQRSALRLHVSVDGASGVADAAALRPDLILLDMQLPDFDGFEVLRQLRAMPATADIPCIALSANAMPDDIDRALQAGMTDYWTKPLDFKAFLAAIDQRFGAPD